MIFSADRRWRLAVVLAAIFFLSASYSYADRLSGEFSLERLGTRGFVIDGDIGPRRAFIAPVGDVDGDGIADIMLDSYEPSGLEFSLVLGGGHLRGRLIAADLRAEGVCFAASTDRHLLRARAAPAGDLDSDGFGDFFICAESAEWPGVDRSGRIYLIFGQREFAGRYLLDEDVGGPSLPGVVFSWSSDLKAQGAVRVSRFGKDLPGFIVLGAEGAAPDKVVGDEAGWAVAGPGDVNGDGFADLLVGAPHTDPPRPIEGGHVYLILGFPSPPAEIDLKELCPRCIRMHGAPDGPNGPNGFGKAIAGIGDVNGDSLADFIIGAHGDCCLIFRATTHGRVYLVLGRREFPQELDLEAEVGRGVIVFDETPGERAGFAVSPAGDMDLDGVPDFLVGAPWASRGTRAFSGAAYLIYGGPQLAGRLALAEVGRSVPGLSIPGELAGDRLGWEVSFLGDVSGDGLGDVGLVATLSLAWEEVQKTRPSRAYVLFGGFEETLEVLRVEPPEGPLRGDYEVSLWGSGFAEDAEVRFGGMLARVISAPSSSELRVRVPEGSALGAVDVEVRRGGRASRLERGFEYVRDLPAYPLESGSLAFLDDGGTDPKVAVVAGGPEGGG